jgi:hypothetical protein
MQEVTPVSGSTARHESAGTACETGPAGRATDTRVSTVNLPEET